MGIAAALTRSRNRPPQSRQVDGLFGHACTGTAVITGHGALLDSASQPT